MELSMTGMSFKALAEWALCQYDQFQFQQSPTRAMLVGERSTLLASCDAYCMELHMIVSVCIHVLVGAETPICLFLPR